MENNCKKCHIIESNDKSSSESKNLIHIIEHTPKQCKMVSFMEDVSTHIPKKSREKNSMAKPKIKKADKNCKKTIVKILDCDNESKDTDSRAKGSTAEKLLVDKFFDTEAAVESDTENSESDLTKKMANLGVPKN